ncbi:MAG TPA: zinc-binding dehydrogenase [Actinomycetota bacterium]|nr:zinc-binding dehydrogenase [Actinomycetota bacterium]
MTGTMRVARLHGIEDLRVEEVPVPVPGPTELLVRVEANGVCATDARKFRVGVNDGEYPFNPGHEWIGRVERPGGDVVGWQTGQRVYGDTYGGYAEYVVIDTVPKRWSCGPTRVPDDVPVERAIFLEPLADCLHALVDHARIRDGQRIGVVAAGSMGLQMTALASRLGASVTAIEPKPERRDLARRFGASEAIPPDGWVERVRASAPGGLDAVIVCAGDPALVEPSIEACADRGTVVLFAGFGDRPRVEVDLNALHYREVSLVGSEWVGVPSHARCERYADAVERITDAGFPLEELVTHRCSFDDLEDALIGRGSFDVLKTMFTPDGGGRG